MTWIVRLEGGPAFPANCAAACRLASAQFDRGPTRECFDRLAAALDQAQPGPIEVHVVYEGPDMSYYGDAEIHGVYEDAGAARAKAIELDPGWALADGSEISRYHVAPCQVIPKGGAG